MRKLLLFFGLLLFSGLASATEINTDPGFDNPSAYTIMGASPAPTIAGSHVTFNGATAMVMVSQASNAIKEGHKYKFTWTQSSLSAGSVMAYAGLTMMGSSGGAYIPAPLSDTADNFTTSLGIQTGNTPTDSTDPVGAFRMFCGPGPIRPDDPLVYANNPGRSHFHQFFGNTRVNSSTTWTNLRQRGGTSCGTDSAHPINRSGYWFPAMLDGHGNVIQPDVINLYYKAHPVSSTVCGVYDGGATHIGVCVPLPNGIRFIWGYNTTTNLGGAQDGQAGGVWFECWDFTGGSANITGPYSHMNQLFASGSNPCPLGSKVVIQALAPVCWDGINLDTPNHRDHMIRGIGPQPSGAFFQSCPSDHPYVIPNIALQIGFTIDADFVAGKVHCSSDEMVAGVSSSDPCRTFHTDYFEGWSPSGKATWQQFCIDAKKSCSSGNLGNVTQIKGGGSAPWANGADTPLDNNPKMPLNKVPTTQLGRSKPCSANGTCSAEIIAAGAHEFGLVAYDGANVQIDNLSVTEITSGHHGPVTVHN